MWANGLRVCTAAPALPGALEQLDLLAQPLDRAAVPKEAYKCPAFENKEKPMLL